MGTDAGPRDNDNNTGRTKQDVGQMKEPEMSGSLQAVVALQCNSQHQSDKLSDRPREWRDMPETQTHWHTFNTHTQESWCLTYHERRETEWVSTCRLELVQSTGAQCVQQCSSVLNLLEWFVSWLRDWASASSSFGGSAEVTAQTFFTARSAFSPPPPPPPSIPCLCLLCQPSSVQHTTAAAAGGGNISQAITKRGIAHQKTADVIQQEQIKIKTLMAKKNFFFGVCVFLFCSIELLE